MSTEPLPKDDSLDGGDPRALLILIGRSDRPYHPVPIVVELDRLRYLTCGRGEEQRVGRSGPTLRLELDDHCLSSVHLRITRSGRGGRASYTLEDLGSRNGCRVGGVRVRSAYALQPGDIIETGRCFWKFWRGLLPQGEEPLPGSYGGGRIRVDSTFCPEVLRAQKALPRVAASNMPLILYGESGTGKEVLARRVHRLSGREGKYLAINCAAIPEGLIESELFGHERGAFTGAVTDRMGVIERARRGTLLLDEVGDMPPPAQAKLLRVLQEGHVARVGGPAREVDVRFLAATHQDLRGMVEEKRFRGDLYARLNGFELRIPPLRARKEDIGILVAGLLREIEASTGRRYALAHDVMRALLAYDWPFNVRELEKAVKIAAALCGDEGQISLAHLPEAQRMQKVGRPIEGSAVSEPRGLENVRRGSYGLEGHLRARLVLLLNESEGNISLIARRLDTSRSQVRRLLERFNLDVEPFRN